MRNLKRECVLATVLTLILSLVSFGLPKTGNPAALKFFPVEQPLGYNASTTPALEYFNTGL